MAWMLEHVGWCRKDAYQDSQGQKMLSEPSWGNPPSAMCLFGAWNLVEADREVKDMAWEAMGQIGPNPIEFNDAPGRTKSEVLDLIKRTKKALKK